MNPFRTALLVVLATGCRLDNPPVTQSIQWDSERTEELARRACYDCHSNETEWPWTSYVPVLGSVIASDVHRARCHMNFSEWDGPNEEAWDAPDEIRDGDMPLGAYTMMHAKARLTDGELEELAQGFERTFALHPPLDGEACDDDGGRDDRDDDRGRDDARVRRRVRTAGASVSSVAVDADIARAASAMVAAWTVSRHTQPIRAELSRGDQTLVLEGTWTRGPAGCALQLGPGVIVERCDAGVVDAWVKLGDGAVRSQWRVSPALDVATEGEWVLDLEPLVE